MITSEPVAVPLIARLIDHHGYEALSADTLEAFVMAPGNAVIFAAGDFNRLDEVADVAVVLPELMAAFPDTFRVGVTRDRETEMAVQRMYRFNAFPALVFTRDGGWLGTIQRMQDWTDYLRDVHGFLAAEPQDPPRFELPEGCQVVAPEPKVNHDPNSTSAIQSRS